MDSDKASGAHPKDHPLYAPGLALRSRMGGDVPMWIPPRKDVKKGYLPKSLTLDRTDSQLEIAEACRAQWKDLLDWRTGKPKPIRYTISWLIDRYLNDETSPFQRVGADTQDSYGWECKRIRETVGEMRLDPKNEGGVIVQRRTGEDFRRWFQNWGHPKPREVLQPDGSMKLVEQKPTPSRATHCIAMLRTLLNYYTEIGGPGARELRETLSAMEFERSPARDKAPTLEQVNAIVTKAEEMGFRSIAITTLAQYELIERRAHIIGKWVRDEWRDGWVWEGISPEWIITYYQTKKGRVLREYDLKVVQQLLGMMQETPKEQRHGPIIICEQTGEPWIKRRYQEKFREIARAAGVPDEVFSMDMRSGGATEADGAGVSDRELQDAGGWKDQKMLVVYRRDKQRNANVVVLARQTARNKP